MCNFQSSKGVETRTKDDGIVTFVSWDRMLHVYETQTTYYFYISKNNAFILPKRHFISIKQLLESQVYIIEYSKDKYQFIPF